MSCFVTGSENKHMMAMKVSDPAFLDSKYFMLADEKPATGREIAVCAVALIGVLVRSGPNPL